MTYPNYLRLHRKAWFLSQEELAMLFENVSEASISRFELGQETPRAEVLLGYEIAFGDTPKKLYPKLHEELEDEIMRRAAKLDKALAGKEDTRSIIKREFLRQLAERAGGDFANA
jgi:hypothetical protein